RSNELFDPGIGCWVLHGQEQPHGLQFLGKGLLLEVRIEGEIGLQIGVLRLHLWGGVGPDRNGGRGPLEVKQGMNVAASWQDLPGVTHLQTLDTAEPQLANREVRADLLFILEVIVAVDARAQEDLEGSGKAVLVNGGGSVHPEIHVNVKPWSSK